jgi:hypothetical protein
MRCEPKNEKAEIEGNIQERITINRIDKRSYFHYAFCDVSYRLDKINFSWRFYPIPSQMRVHFMSGLQGCRVAGLQCYRVTEKRHFHTQIWSDRDSNPILWNHRSELMSQSEKRGNFERKWRLNNKRFPRWDYFELIGFFPLTRCVFYEPHCSVWHLGTWETSIRHVPQNTNLFSLYTTQCKPYKYSPAPTKIIYKKTKKPWSSWYKSSDR